MILTFKKGHKYQFTEETRKKLSLQKMGSKNPNFGKKLSEKIRKKMSVARKGGNDGSFKKGERRSRKTEFKKGQIPHNKGKKATLAERKINLVAQKKRWDRIGRQTKEELDSKERVRMKKKRMNPNFVKNERIYNKKMYAKDPEKHKTISKLWREKNPNYTRDRDFANKLKVLGHYSKVISNSDIPCCACCGEKLSHKFLTLDHIDGRKTMGHKQGFGGDKLYRWTIKNNFPSGLQVLCWNCNSAKGLFGKCPHQK